MMYLSIDYRRQYYFCLVNISLDIGVNEKKKKKKISKSATRSI